MSNLDRETDVSVDCRGAYVTYRMIPEVAEALAGVLEDRATVTDDTGWRQDAARLRSAVDNLTEAER